MARLELNIMYSDAYSRYPVETLNEDYDDGTMPENVERLSTEVVGHRIVSAERVTVPRYPDPYYANDPKYAIEVFQITLDNGKKVRLRNTDDCCAYTELEEFLLHPNSVDHIILGVGTTDGYNTWHIYADWGDMLKLTVGWSCGNPFYYGYGFDIQVVDV